MPLFSKKFSPKQTTPRKADVSALTKDSCIGSKEDLSVDIGPIKLKLGEQETVFENGEWVPETGTVSGTHKENKKLKLYVQQLEEENNLLKLKLEILLDMLTQTAAESHLQLKEIEKLKSRTKVSHCK